MAEPSSSRKRSNNEGFLGVANKKNPKSKHEENKFMSRVLLPNRLNLTLELEDASEDMSVAKFADIEITEKGSRKIHGGSQVFVEDAMGERIEEGNIICQASRNKPMIIALQVACRDFPHPRQFCVMFPFNSTPHEKHCALGCSSDHNSLLNAMKGIDIVISNMGGSETIEQLKIVDAIKEVGTVKHDNDYLGIIAAEKGSSKAKQLASQLILLLQVFPKSLK